MPPRAADPDCLEYEDLAKEAAMAFSADVSYAIGMARQAANVTSKRDTWTARTALRKAEKEAQSKCLNSNVRFCANHGPCGTGGCPFAQGLFAQLWGADVEKGPGSRPRPSAFPAYSLESLVRPLVALQTGP